MHVIRCGGCPEFYTLYKATVDHDLAVRENMKDDTRYLKDDGCIPKLEIKTICEKCGYENNFYYHVKQRYIYD